MGIKYKESKNKLHFINYLLNDTDSEVSIIDEGTWGGNAFCEILNHKIFLFYLSHGEVKDAFKDGLESFKYNVEDTAYFESLYGKLLTEIVLK